MIDLHCHSHFSDGALSPDALLAKAVHAGVKILALTDHDTTDGLQALRTAALDTSVQIVNGIELSTRWKKYDIHIIGLRVTPDDVGLCALIDKQNQSRIARALEIGERLTGAGIRNAYQKACEVAGHTRVGRPHFAQVMVQEKLVPDMAQAFKRFLGQGRCAYVPTSWISVTEAVEGIQGAGGQAVIAHPLKYKLTRSKLHELMDMFKSAGGSGVEVVSGLMTVTEMIDLAGICQRFGLLASSGSDFHSDASHVSLGRQQPLPLNCTPIWEQWMF